jgi:hypothetical protein
MDSATQATLTTEIKALPAGTSDWAAYQQLLGKQIDPDQVRQVFSAFQLPNFQAILTALQTIPAASLSTLNSMAIFQAVNPNYVPFQQFRDLFQSLTIPAPKPATPSAATTATATQSGAAPKT